MPHHHLVLVPGFFGFTSLGGLEYFCGVRAELERHFSERGMEVKIHEVVTLPTASIRHRAARILDLLVDISADSDGPIHLIGHSTGGLDARLAIAPTASLPTKKNFEAYGRVKTLITLATPHAGTPLAELASSAMGKPLLRLVALSTVFALRQGRMPLRLAFKAGYLWNRLDDYVGLDNTVMDQLYADLLQDFTSERQQQLVELIHQVATDQSLLVQLTAAGCDLLNAGTGDPENVRYGCVVTRARPFGLGGFLSHRHNIYAHSLHLVFGALYTALSRASQHYQAPISEAQGMSLQQGFAGALSLRDNDGIVPSLSQVWGEVIHTAQADHLDVVGHFLSSAGAQRRADFIPSASGFDERAFSHLWRDVAAFISSPAPAARR